MDHEFNKCNRLEFLLDMIGFGKFLGLDNLIVGLKALLAGFNYLLLAFYLYLPLDY